MHASTVLGGTHMGRNTVDCSFLFQDIHSLSLEKRAEHQSCIRDIHVVSANATRSLLIYTLSLTSGHRFVPQSRPWSLHLGNPLHCVLHSEHVASPLDGHLTPCAQTQVNPATGSGRPLRCDKTQGRGVMVRKTTGSMDRQGAPTPDPHSISPMVEA
jgi:hypothetical protein